MYPKGVVVDFSNFEECIALLNTINNKSVMFYDLTVNKTFDHETIFSVRDHINCTGSNPLVGKQKKQNIEFVDMTSVYQCSGDGVITHSCGNILDVRFEYPSYYLAHIVIIARALKFKNIGSGLINKNII